MGRFSRLQGAPDRELDDTPLSMPLGAKRPTSLQDYIARMVRDAVEAEKGEQFESWDEADDFEEEDPDVLDFSQYELQTLQEESGLQDYGLEADPKIAQQEAPQEETGDTANPNPSEPDR